MAPHLTGLVAKSPTGEVAKTPPNARKVGENLLRILRETQLCSVATVDLDGKAHLNTAYFAFTQDLAVYFLSHPGSRHSQNLMDNGSAAVAVFRSDQRWGGHDRGVQLVGDARRTFGAARARAEVTYSARFPLYDRWLQARTPSGRKAAAQVRSYAFYQFRPKTVVVFDEGAFGLAPFVTATVRLRG
jgi:uncharacterized protein YhbP (UPF0306 family)